MHNRKGSAWENSDLEIHKSLKKRFGRKTFDIKDKWKTLGSENRKIQTTE
jgi:hypothetical protein